MFGTPYVWSQFLVQASDCDGGTTTPTAANWNASTIRKVTALWSSEAHFQKELQRALWEPERYIPNETKLGNNRAELSLIMGKCWNTYSIQTPFENSFRNPLHQIYIDDKKRNYRIYKKRVEQQKTTNARILYEYNTKQSIERPLPTALGVFPYVNTRKWECKRTQII